MKPLSLQLLIGFAILGCGWGADERELPPASSRFEVRRMGTGPIIHPDMPGLEGELGSNINGPSLIRVPDWVEEPLGRYYLYFAHHRGDFIRMAYADQLEGPWTIHEGGVLHMRDAPGEDHIASPDVIVDPRARRIRMYFHQPGGRRGEAAGMPRQVSFLALSEDGLSFKARDEMLGGFYFRVFEHGGHHYAVAKNGNVDGMIYRSKDGLSGFEVGPHLLPRVRHTALWVEDESLHLVFTRAGDSPESLLLTTLSLSRDWHDWRPGAMELLLSPEHAWEGADLPVRPSRYGASKQDANELRDPAIYQEDGRTYLLYTVKGESGIALAEIVRVESEWEEASRS